MFFNSIQVDQNVIKVDEVQNIKKVIKVIISVCLHRYRSICKAQGHDKIFKVFIVGSKCSFSFIAKSNLQLVEDIIKIELSVVLRILNAVNKF